MVKTVFEVFGLLDPLKDYKIQATDKEGNTQTVISSANALRYMKRKYAERRYQLLSGGDPQTVAEAATEFHSDYNLFMVNRQHNIDKMYQALFDYDYSPIENVDRHESETTVTDGETNYGKTLTDSGTDRTTYGKTDTKSGTDSTTYGKTLTDSGTDSTTYGHTETNSGTDTTTYGKVETNSGTDTTADSGTDTVTHNGTHEVANEKSGFNAPATYTPDTHMTETWTNDVEATQYGKTEELRHGHAVTESGSDTLGHGHVVTESGTDSLLHGKVETAGGSDSITYGETNTQSGSDSTTYGKTETASGKDEEDVTVTRTLHTHGNIGVTTNTQLINEELELRQIALAELLIDNFINDYTFYS